MATQKRVNAKYIYLDVVGFSCDRSVNAQSVIISQLNEIVRTAIKNSVGPRRKPIPDNKLILLPTGDGLCIALCGVEKPIDIHMRIALGILEGLDEYNMSLDEEESDSDKEQYKFELRIGISANIDNIVRDINENDNICGAGINMAQRIMSLADGNQILVSHSVWDVLIQDDLYMDKFEDYRVTVKHGKPLDVHQYTDNDCPGLNIIAPSRCTKKPAFVTPTLCPNCFEENQLATLRSQPLQKKLEHGTIIDLDELRRGRTLRKPLNNIKTIMKGGKFGKWYVCRNCDSRCLKCPYCDCMIPALAGWPCPACGETVAVNSGM